ncbi:MAG: phosphoserine phosphatase RsbU/P [Actinomycetota bacterium]
MSDARRSATFAALPASIREARLFVTGWLSEEQLDGFSERVLLAVSELATNAVLHTARPFTVSAHHVEERIRVEVIDSAPQLVPMRVPMSGSAVDITSFSETGRGLQIVSSLAQRWGMELAPNVKTVWCEFEGAAPPAQPSDPAIEDHRAPAAPPADLHRLLYIGLPVRAAIASGVDVEDAIRDVQLGPADDRAGALLTLVDRTAPLRLAGRHAAMHAAGQNLLRFDLELDATSDALAALGELNRVLADQRVPSADVVAFRAWLGDETRRQLDGKPPTSFPGNGLSDQAGWLWDQAASGYASLTPDGRVMRVNAALLRLLDREPAAIAGRSFLELLDRESQGAYTEVLAPALLASGQIQEAKVTLVRADGSPLGALLSAVLERDATGAPVAIRAVLDADASPERGDPRADELVHALQQTLIPPAPPAVPGLDVAAAYHPGQGEVGGDFYDVFEVADGDWCVVLGDVSGKGIEAAILTAAARHAVRSAALREPVPSDLMRALNRALIIKGNSRFCTVALLRIHLTHGAWVATLTSGGHPFPLLVRHGSATKLGRPGSLLGVFEDVEFHDVSIRLAVGDALVFYTDGVTEARTHEGEFYGEDRMHDAIIGASQSAQAIVDAVVGNVLEFQAGASDDIALVVVRRPPL